MTSRNERLPLDLPPGTSEALGRQALDFVVRQLGELPDAPASDYRAPARLSARLRRPPADDPGDFAALLEVFRQAAAQGVNTAGAGYLAYFPAGGLVSSALAELLAQVANRYTGVAQTAPALVEMEEGVLAWLAGRFGAAHHAIRLLSGGAMRGLPAGHAPGSPSLWAPASEWPASTRRRLARCHVRVSSRIRSSTTLPHRMVRNWANWFW
ncbi:pyridoxal-dependent decarboxylase [Nonomuraea sp. 3-1Str]|uniref:hypothetical protein n=1 Tax=Nonomuraea sp. 3-1Str TaxID=2929801 RepID=UPI002858D368|nr:hypothetical protein [Nonomuraea sp. 3-1Str]MDR8413718.1 pyridoxal-dependent decarboxylase [Nonomuraea sp. 3-1Str]